MVYSGLKATHWQRLSGGLSKFRPKKNVSTGKPLRSLVSGASITGLICALRLAAQGFEVDIFERRKTYSRNIQWAARQSLIDTLATIDYELAAIFLEEIAGPLPGGSRFVAEVSSLYPHGAYWNKPRPRPKPGNPHPGSPIASEMLEAKAVCAFAARRFESLLIDYIGRNPLVVVNYTDCPQFYFDEAANAYQVSGRAAYDLIVIAEGAASDTRSAIGLEMFPVSRPARQIAGSVFMKRSGIMIKHLNVERSEGGNEEFLLSGLISSLMEPTSWIVGDLAESVCNELDVAPSEADRRAVLRQAFTQIASRCMLNSEENIAEARFEGAVLEKDVQDFTLSAQLCSSAVAGENLVLAGDAVGTGHWSVGGGMQIGAVLHSARVDALAEALASGADRRVAIRNYDKSVRTDTKAWIREGISDFYIGIPAKLAVDAFDNAIALEDKLADCDCLEKLHDSIRAGVFPKRLSQRPT